MIMKKLFFSGKLNLICGDYFTGLDFNITRINHDYHVSFSSRQSLQNTNNSFVVPVNCRSASSRP